jgi:hypothetical protein
LERLRIAVLCFSGEVDAVGDVAFVGAPNEEFVEDFDAVFLLHNPQVL